MYESEEWKEALTDNGWEDVFLVGDEFGAYIEEERTRVHDVLVEIGLIGVMSVQDAPSSDRPADHTGSVIAPDRKPIGELGMAALLGVLGVVVLIGARGITQPGSSNTIGPRFFPYLVGGLPRRGGDRARDRRVAAARWSNRRAARTSTPPSPWTGARSRSSWSHSLPTRC